MIALFTTLLQAVQTIFSRAIIFRPMKRSTSTKVLGLVHGIRRRDRSREGRVDR